MRSSSKVLFATLLLCGLATAKTKVGATRDHAFKDKWNSFKLKVHGLSDWMKRGARPLYEPAREALEKRKRIPEANQDDGKEPLYMGGVTTNDVERIGRFLGEGERLRPHH